MSQPHRKAALNLYKTLLFLGRDWPQGYDLFRKRLHKVFQKNSGETDPEKIQTMIKHGEFVVKEIEALYKLKKYRTLKRSLPHVVRGSQWCGLQLSYKYYDPSCTRSKNLYEECGPPCCARSQCA